MIDMPHEWLVRARNGRWFMSIIEMLIRRLRFILFMVLMAWVIAVGSIHWLTNVGWEGAPAAVNEVAAGK